MQIKMKFYSILRLAFEVQHHAVTIIPDSDFQAESFSWTMIDTISDF